MKNKLILPGSTIGILGGGQLGRMMALSAKQMGYKVAVLDPTANCPCAQVADIHIEAKYDDLNGAKRLADVSDVITYEFENVDRDIASYLEEQAYLPQGAQLLSITQDRAKEKEAIELSGVPVARYQVIESKEDLIAAVQTIGYPSVLKTCRGGYDGKGQLKLTNKEDLNEAITWLKEDQTYVLEQWISFECEISVVFSRDQNGEVTTFPVSENRHENQVLRQSIVPAKVSSEVIEKAERAAIKIAEVYEIIGTFAVEMFVIGDEIIINEMAPRPHNSGHYTIDACNVSQFEQHIRAICGLPLLPVYQVNSATMINLLGDEINLVVEEVSRLSYAHLHIYGKEGIKPGRKMGHVTFVGVPVEETVEILKEIKAPAL